MNLDFSELQTNITHLYNFIYASTLPKYVIFLLFTLLSILLGRYTPPLVGYLVRNFVPSRGQKIYENLIEPLHKPIKNTGTLILIYLSLAWLKNYQSLYEFIHPFFALAVTISIAWLASRLFRQVVRFYGINLINKLGREVDELLLIFETLANLIIGFVAAVAFAQSQNINLVGLLASLGIGGLAIAFAAQNTLEQLLGTVVLYLDRPFISGEYIRLPNGVFGRVESIGLRSTKIRTAAKGTVLIVPNSNMANIEIENITRGKKVMVLLYLDFKQLLKEREQVLVEQVIKESTNSVFGIDPGSTKISLFKPEDSQVSRARVSFFILGSSENSLELRKRLLELANGNISQQLVTYGIEFQANEPTIYVESPVTI